MGLQLAEPGFETRCFVEWEKAPQDAIIAAQRAGYFAPAPIWDDITTFDGKPWRGICDTILAGYPCQPFSAAGQRKGHDDDRHLWPDVARIIQEVEPRWVFLENVAGHISLGAESVLRELRDMGYTSSVGAFSAAETGAAHERLRWFCVAYRGGTGLERHTGDGFGGDQSRRIDKETRGSTSKGRPYVSPPGPGDSAAWAAVLSHSPDLAPAISLRDIKRACDHFATMVARGELAEGEAQSRICGMADGMAQRTRALKLLGNGVHPLAAANAWRDLATAHGLGPVDLGTADRDNATGTDGI